MAAVEEDLDLISDDEDLVLPSDEEDLEEDDLDDEEVEDEAENVDEDEEEDVEEDVEEEIEEEEEDVEEDVEEDEDEDLSFKDVYDDEPVKTARRQKVRIERYCKSLNETNPREHIPRECSQSSAFEVLKRVTTEKNALAFSKYITTKKQLFEICGKVMAKNFGNKELFQELKAGVWGYHSQLYYTQKRAEEAEIRIMTTKMEVVEGLYTCRRCKSQKTYSRQVQTRSADEGMTSIIQCSKCSLVWREYA
jgi:DNA-directed RNA polymerase subunit M/transcription elongation factor TFIIS